MSIDNRLAELGITLPEAAAPVAVYVPYVEANGFSTSRDRFRSRRTAP